VEHFPLHRPPQGGGDYNDGERTRGVVGLADYALPFAGTAASTLLSWRRTRSAPS
jgi:hypothetical protein